MKKIKSILKFLLITLFACFALFVYFTIIEKEIKAKDPKLFFKENEHHIKNIVDFLKSNDTISGIRAIINKENSDINYSVYSLKTHKKDTFLFYEYDNKKDKFKGLVNEFERIYTFIDIDCPFPKEQMILLENSMKKIKFGTVYSMNDYTGTNFIRMFVFVDGYKHTGVWYHIYDNDASEESKKFINNHKNKVEGNLIKNVIGYYAKQSFW